MLKGMFYRAVITVADGVIKRATRVRAWAWNKVIEGWPAEMAVKILEGKG